VSEGTAALLALAPISLATHFMPLPFALAVFVLLDLANSLCLGLEAPRHLVRGEVARPVPMSLVGTALGASLLVNMPRRAGMLALGCFVVAFALYSLVARALA
jgi:uncharacterized membrane protein YfcA